LVNIFRPISKYSAQILEPENIPEVVRKAFKLAQSEKPGSCFIDVPEKLVLPVEAARGFITTFRSLRPEAVPSDGAPHRLFLKRLSLPFREERTLAAELSEHIFRRIRAPVTGEDPVIEGRAAVFLGGAYLGLARIPTTAPTGELRIDLGVDDRLRVRRRQGDREEEVGVFSKNQRFITEVTIEIENFHGEAMEVEVRERIPFTEEESIRVSLIGKRTAPPPDDHREHAGLLTWRIRVPPGGKSDIRYRYHIDTPRGFQLVRREDPSRLEEGE
ncbi:MAG: mucoidy inhibitor MuiA family protein, partial [Planctomycetota bacterium]